MTLAKSPALENLEGRLLLSSDPQVSALAFAPADFNGDGVATAADIDTLYGRFGPNPQYDLTGDDVVDYDDVKFLVENVLGRSLGDANLDGSVDVADVDILKSNWAGQGGWAQGDLNGDGKVGFSDLEQVLANWGAQSPDVAPAPAQTVTATVLGLGDQAQLLITGTAGADTITLSQSEQGFTITLPSGSSLVSGSFDSVTIYGFGGNDVIRTTHSVTASVYINGGDGDDTIYNAAMGLGTILTGEGNNTVVSIGAGLATITGGSGLDSFWVDAADTLVDVSAASTAAGAVHRVSSFYQPYSSNPANVKYVPLTIEGQSLADPTIDNYASTYKSFANSPLFVGAPEYNDVRQGSCGDCYFLAALASLAQNENAALSQAITALGDGTYAVRFYRNGVANYVRVDADLPVTGGGSLAYAKAGPEGQIWVALMEKAYAYFRAGANSYASLWGGWMGDSYRDVLNAGSTSQSVTVGTNSATMLSTLQNALANGHAVTVASRSTNVGAIVGNHAYMIQAVNGNNVTVYNPWGVDGGGNDGNYGDGLITLSIDAFKQAFSYLSFCSL